MNPGGETPRPVDPPTTESPIPPEARPFYWSVRRELWENRSIYVAPLVVAAIVLLGTLASLAGSRTYRTLSSMAPPEQQAALFKPFSMAPAPIMLATFLVGLFYSLEALYGERRDRSLLFWKSLPVSDRTTVLAKASVPLVVLPAIAFALSLVTLVLLLFLGSAVLAARGVSPAPIWSGMPVLQEPVVMFYGLTVHALWFAPIYGWLLLVSAWARRLPILWAVFPPFLFSAIEGIASGGTRFGALLKHRVTGAMELAFTHMSGSGPSGNIDELAQLTPGRFLAAPGLWLGLAFAAACLAAAVRLRRRREPN